MDFFIIYIFPALIVGGLGLFLFFVNHSHIKKNDEIAEWPKTQGTVISAAFEERKAQRYSRGKIRGGYKVNYFVPAIKYSYKVFGTPYESTGYKNESAGEYHVFKEVEREQIIASYPPGKVVEITYNPDKPSEAYLVPDTSNSRNLRGRMTAIIMLAIALLWVGWGGAVNLKNTLDKKYAEEQIRNSAGLIPATTDQINANLDKMVEAYNLECTEEGYGGMILHYRQRKCKTPTGVDIKWVEVYRRKEDVQKVDLISAYIEPSDQEKTISFFCEVVALGLQGTDLQAAQDWVKATIPTIKESEAMAETEISGLKLDFYNMGMTTRLNIGDFQ